jgi:hypothetical protein
VGLLCFPVPWWVSLEVRLALPTTVEEAVLVVLVAEWVFVAEAGLAAVVVGEGKTSFVTYMAALAAVAVAEGLDDLECLQKPKGRKVHVVAGVVAVVVAVCVDPAGNRLLMISRFAPRNYLIEFVHMQELEQKPCPLQPWQHSQQRQMTVPCLAADAVVK